MTSLREMVSNLEEQLKSTSSTLRSSREATAEKEAEISKIRLLLEQAERSNDELKRRLQTKITEIERLEDGKATLDDNYGKKRRCCFISCVFQFLFPWVNRERSY